MKLISVQNASRLYDFKPCTLYKWVREGTIPHYKIGSLVRFNVAEIDDWLKSYRKEPEPAKKAPKMSFKAPRGGSIDPLDIGRKAIDSILGQEYNESGETRHKNQAQKGG